MKFTYQYRTSDNVSHEGEICAPSREDVYSILKAKGIKPGRVAEAPGFFNKLFGKGKRWIAIALLSSAACVFAWLAFSNSGERDRYSRGGFAIPCERKQIWGDNTVIEVAANDDWRVVFDNPADRLLASFARPGIQVRLTRIPYSITNDFAVALATPIKISNDDLEEYKQVKCIVAGMREELREYVRSGGKELVYIQRLMERQNEEIKLYNLERKGFELAVRQKGANVSDLWKAVNVKMRSAGLPTIPVPEK